MGNIGNRAYILLPESDIIDIVKMPTIIRTIFPEDEGSPAYNAFRSILTKDKDTGKYEVIYKISVKDNIGTIDVVMTMDKLEEKDYYRFQYALTEGNSTLSNLQTTECRYVDNMDNGWVNITLNE